MSPIEHAERIAVLETEVADLKKSVDEMSAQVRTLVSLFDQARGAKWMLIGLAALGGIVASKIGPIIAWMGSLK